MSEKGSATIEDLSAQLKAAEQEQQANVSNSVKELESNWTEGKKNTRELEQAQRLAKQFDHSMKMAEANGIPVSEVIRKGRESNQELLDAHQTDIDLRERKATVAFAEPGVKEAVQAEAVKEDKSFEAKKLTEEAKKSLGIMAQRLSLEIDSLALEYEKAVASIKEKEAALDKDRSERRRLRENVYNELRKIDQSLVQKFDDYNSGAITADQIREEFSKFKESLGLFSLGKKKKMEELSKDLEEIIRLDVSDKDYQDSHKLLYSDNWPGLVKIKEDLEQGVAASADYQSKIDDIENESNRYNGMKRMFLEPVRFRMNTEKEKPAFYSRVKKVIDDVEFGKIK